MFFLIPYLKHFAISLFFIVSFFAVGHALLSSLFEQYKNQKPWFRIFFALFAGFLLSISLYAFIKTHAITVMYLVVLTGLFIKMEQYYNNGRKLTLKLWPIANVWPSPKEILIVLLLALVVFSYESYFVLQNEPFPYITPFYDMLSRSDLIEGLNRFGQEGRPNKYIPYGDEYRGTTLYHYPLSWLAALASYIFGLAPVTGLLLVAHPVLILIYAVGMVSLFEVFTKIKYFHFLAALLLLFCGGIYLSIYDNWPFLTVNFISDSYPMSFLGRKLILVFITLIAFFHFAFRKKFTMAIIVLWLVVPLYSTTLIGVAGATGFVIAISILFRKRLALSYYNINTYRLIVYFAIFGVSILVYNLTTASAFDAKSVHQNSGGSFGFLSGFSIKTFLILSVETLFRVFVYYWLYIPAVVLLWLKAEKEIKRQLLFIIIVLFIGGSLSGLCFSVLNHPNMNFWQAFYNFFMPVMSVSLVLTCIYVWSRLKKNSHKFLFATYFFVLCTYQAINITRFATSFRNNTCPTFYIKQEYSEEYILRVNAFMNASEKEKYGIQLSGKNDLLKGYHDMLAQFMCFNPKFMTGINLSPFTYNFELQELSPTGREFVKPHPFYRFIQKMKDEGNFVSVDDAMLRFVTQNRFIEYMIVSKNVVLYQQLESQFTLFTADSLSGERFYIRKNQ